MNSDTLAPGEARALIRNNQVLNTTSGVSLGFAQANIVIVEKQYAADFHRFCTLHPKACPLLHVSDAGDPRAPSLGQDIDIRTDLPGYHVHRQGQPYDECANIQDLWRDDFVTFYIGCSFSFEEALLSHGVRIPHIEQSRNVSMYQTNITLTPAGKFHGNLVVSMRGLSAADAIKAIQITSVMARVHGAPVHIGNPELIGIKNLQQPDYGDAPELTDTDLPTFWACGVTSLLAVANAQLPIAITHAPGKMLITDVPNWELRFS